MSPSGIREGIDSQRANILSKLSVGGIIIQIMPAVFQVSALSQEFHLSCSEGADFITPKPST